MPDEDAAAAGERVAGATRRPLLLGIAGVSMLFDAPELAHAQRPAASVGPAVMVGLFVDLDRAVVPNDVQVLKTIGFARPGVGGAHYVATESQVATAFRARTANGRWFELSEPTVFVEMFGALGDDPVFDDQPAIQAAVDYNEAAVGGAVWCSPGRRYHLRAPVTINPTRTSIEGGSATWVLEAHSARGPGDSAVCVIRDPPPPAGAQYGQDSHYCRSLRLAGAPQGVPPDGFYFDTGVEMFSSRWTFYNVDATENLSRGLVLKNRAYLVKSYASSFIGTDAGVECLGGRDAGENFSFFGGNIGSSGGAALRNNGGEFYLFGVSVDFPKSFILQTAGAVHCFGCHFETGLRAGAIGALFDITGELYIDGGAIMGGAPLDGSPIPFEYFFTARDRHSRITLSNVWGYNWQCAQHVLCGGDGRLRIDHLQGGWNWNIPGIVKRDATHSLVGDAGLFERDDARLDMWVTAPNSTRRIDRHQVVWSDHGRDFANALVQVTSTAARTGKRGLSFRKTGVGGGTDVGLQILMSVPGGGGRLRSCEFWVRREAAAPAAAPQRLFTQLAWANLHRARRLRGSAAGAIDHDRRGAGRPGGRQRLGAPVIRRPTLRRPG